MTPGHRSGTPTRERLEGLRLVVVVAERGVWAVVDDLPDRAGSSSALLFLTSDEARYITGSTLSIDAGCAIR